MSLYTRLWRLARLAEEIGVSTTELQEWDARVVDDLLTVHEALLRQAARERG